MKLAVNTRIKGQKDWEKYELARKLKYKIIKIRQEYMADMRDKRMMKRQRAVALYFIDRLALRVGNEKNAKEEADTVSSIFYLGIIKLYLHSHFTTVISLPGRMLFPSG